MVENIMELYNKILEIINTTINGEYKGKFSIDVEKDWNDQIFTLKIEIDSREVPLTFVFQGSQDNFLKYIKHELKNKRNRFLNKTKATLINMDETPQLYPILEI